MTQRDQRDDVVEAADLQQSHDPVSPRRPSRDAIPESLHHSTLANIINGFVLPAVKSQYPLTPLEGNGEAKGPISTDEVVEFSRLCMHKGFESALYYSDRIREKGIPTAVIYTSLLAPAARHMGKLWETDRATFVDVSIGLTAITQLFHRMNPQRVDTGPARGRLPSILLAPTPGDQHGFGLLLVSDAFHRAGWHVAGGAGTTIDDVLGAVSETEFDFVGFSLSTRRLFPALVRGIDAVREASLSKTVQVMVGGHAFNSNPKLAKQLDADVCMTSPKAAVAYADCFVAEKLRNDLKGERPAVQ